MWKWRGPLRKRKSSDRPKVGASSGAGHMAWQHYQSYGVLTKMDIEEPYSGKPNEQLKVSDAGRYLYPTNGQQLLIPFVGLGR